MTKALTSDGIKPSGVWFPWPDGWRDGISTALIDAVYSARATYKTKNRRGIHPLVSEWNRAHAGPGSWAEDFGNSQHSPGRSIQRPEDPLKSAAVLEAAKLLIDADIESAGDVNLENHLILERVLRSVPGIGEATSTYFMMLLGIPGVKADVMIRRYVSRALGTLSSTTSAAIEAVTRAASQLGVELMDLEHTIWEVERRRVT